MGVPVKCRACKAPDLSEDDFYKSSSSAVWKGKSLSNVDRPPPQNFGYLLDCKSCVSAIQQVKDGRKKTCEACQKCRAVKFFPKEGVRCSSCISAATGMVMFKHSIFVPNEYAGSLDYAEDHIEIMEQRA